MSKLSQPAVRRAAYFVVAAVLAVLVAVGLVSEEQYEIGRASCRERV